MVTDEVPWPKASSDDTLPRRIFSILERQNSNQNGRSNSRRRHPNQSQNKRRPQAQGIGTGQGDGPNRRRGFNRRRYRPFRIRPEHALLKKYYHLLETHNLARKKYFELFFRADHNQRIKLEKIFYRTLEELRNFEDSLSTDDRQLLDKAQVHYPKETTYSNFKEIDPDKRPIAPEGPFEDPHFTSAGATGKYHEDTEESLGTLDDYQSYKSSKM